MTRRLGIVLRFDPYDLWDRRSLRQLLSLGQSYKDSHATDGGNKESSSPEPNSGGVRNGVRVPDWYSVPKGAKVLNIDTIQQGDLR